MAVYQAPKGYSFDPASGLWVKKMVVSDKAGVQYDHRYYFNADTGEYRQESFALGEGMTKAGGKSKGKVIGLAVAVTAVAAILISVVVVASKESKKSEIPYIPEDELKAAYEEYDFGSTPNSTLDMVEYNGYVEEEGIIR